MGTALLRERIHELEEENRRMHVQVAESRKLREHLEIKEAELASKRKALGLPEIEPARPGLSRPGSARPRTGRPRTAASAAETILELSQGLNGGGSVKGIGSSD